MCYRGVIFLCTLMFQAHAATVSADALSDTHSASIQVAHITGLFMRNVWRPLVSASLDTEEQRKAWIYKVVYADCEGDVVTSMP